MALTQSEVEAKLAALEERISFLTQVTDTLEWRFDQGVERWDRWVAELRDALTRITRQLDRVRKHIPQPPRP